MALPLKCIQTPLPYKPGHVLSREVDLAMPREHHPAFYGCFDWHSAVHGHWSIVYLLKQFPNIDPDGKVVRMLRENITERNISYEIAYFELNRYTSSFERTYGWAWLLKLGEELYSWDNDFGRELYSALKPLCDLLIEKYLDYLPKLVYPIRVGEHTNTAFGLTFAYDYANAVGRSDLVQMIESRAMDFYGSDLDCPLSWEPSGYDFLSPCLSEAYLMSKVLSKRDFSRWVDNFLPVLKDEEFKLAPGEVRDRSDGKLVHLDGLNFSRAWCLYEISKKLGNRDLREVADEHMAYSLDKMVDGDYSGEHWLASFALYGYKCGQN